MLSELIRRACQSSLLINFFPPPFHILDCTITKFLNRILGLEVHQQNFLFQYFINNFEYLIEKDKKEGKYDMGILGKEQFYTPWLCVYDHLNMFVLNTAWFRPHAYSYSLNQMWAMFSNLNHYSTL